MHHIFTVCIFKLAYCIGTYKLLHLPCIQDTGKQEQFCKMLSYLIFYSDSVEHIPPTSTNTKYQAYKCQLDPNFM